MIDHERRCGTCESFALPWFSEAGDADALGSCTWKEDDLPWSLRWANRERVSVSASEGAACPCWKSRAVRDPITKEREN